MFTTIILQMLQIMLENISLIVKEILRIFSTIKEFLMTRKSIFLLSVCVVFVSLFSQKLRSSSENDLTFALKVSFLQIAFILSMCFKGSLKFISNLWDGRPALLLWFIFTNWPLSDHLHYLNLPYLNENLRPQVKIIVQLLQMFVKQGLRLPYFSRLYSFSSVLPTGLSFPNIVCHHSNVRHWTKI